MTYALSMVPMSLPGLTLNTAEAVLGRVQELHEHWGDNNTLAGRSEPTRGSTLQFTSTYLLGRVHLVLVGTRCTSSPSFRRWPTTLSTFPAPTSLLNNYKGNAHQNLKSRTGAQTECGRG
ncbi:hypothetical protein B0H10DRAFT_2050859 [Mycena sp. CBHHK59/15]|nr:hypothetical protein B0H10DRAFT_2050859 [Mycena sp. CBHHK59/15]